MSILRERTRVVNRHHEPYDVYIGRGTPWGNPYSHLPASVFGTIQVATREEAIGCYAEYLLCHPELRRRAKAELRGLRLGCSCKPKSCHGDLLAMVADGGSR